jgi:hypothetical protein
MNMGLFRKVLFLSVLPIIILSGFSCNSPNSITKPNATDTSVSTTAEKPFLSSSEVIAIAKRDAVDHPTWAHNEKIAARYTSSTQGWNAKYSDNGKWTVDFRIENSDGASVTIYRWSVFETNLTAIYIGEFFEEKPDLASKMSEEQVIEIVQSQGVPGCYENALTKPLGDWTAVLGETSVWLVTGNVEIVIDSQNFSVSSQWVYNGYTLKLQSPLVLPVLPDISVDVDPVTSYSWSPGTISLGSSTKLKLKKWVPNGRPLTFSIQIMNVVSTEIVKNYNITTSGWMDFECEFTPPTKGSYYIRLIYNGDIIWSQPNELPKLKVF